MMPGGTITLDPTPLLATFGDASGGEIARTLGVSRRTIVRWRNGHNRVDARNADRYAISTGRHPLEVWPEWT